MGRVLIVLVCASLLSAQAPSAPGTLTLPVGTVCHTDNATGRPVCVMPSEQPQPQPQPLPPLPSPPAPAPFPPPPKCPSFYAAGADYTLNGSPKWTGWAAIATLFPGVTCDPKSGFQPRSISQYIAKIERVNGVQTIVTTTTTGIALPMQRLGRINIYILGTIGPAVTGSTSTVKLGSSYGAVATVPLKWGILVTPALQWVNGTRSFWIGFGRAFGK